MKTIPLLILLMLLASVPFRVGAETPPNIVLFLVDDMGWMDCSPYGSEYYETPAMERFASESMRFTDAYAVPLCSPTRATILTGQYSSRHGVTSASGHQPARAPGTPRYPEVASPNKALIYAHSKNYLDPALTTVAEVLEEAGYRTGHFGKWHLGSAPEHRPDQHGFDTAWYAVPDPGPPSYFSPYQVNTEGEATSSHRIGTIKDGPDGEYITDRITEEVIEFLRKDLDPPFFLNLWQYGLHGPWGHKEEYTSEFARKTDPRGEQGNPIMASMIQSVDESLGRILDELESLGLADNTLFIFFSDNGGNVHSNRAGDPKLAKVGPGHSKYGMVQDWRKWAGGDVPTNNSPLREGKARIYEGGQRVPLMIRWPGHVEEGSVEDAVVHAIDLYPTILEVAGLDLPKDHVVDGESLVPILNGEGELKREAIFNWFPHIIPAVSVRSGDYKMIFRWEPHPDYPETRELYDLSSDLGETDNLAKAMPEKVADMEKLIEGFIAETDALEPIPNPSYRGRAETQRATDTGLVPKASEAVIENGVYRVIKTGRQPFIGSGAVKDLTGPVTATFEIRGVAGGSGFFLWKRTDEESFPGEGQRVPYTLDVQPDWQIVKVELPVEGTPGIIRLYLPPEADQVEFKSIEYAGSNRRSRRWEFGE
ncbi:MAG: sulfatase [Verrucomicrobiota bacterium]